MIITKLQGGLGNQMFQYALGRHLAILNETELRLDLSFLLDRTPQKDFVFRDYDLSVFNIQEKFAEKGEVENIRGKQQNSILGKIISKYNKKIWSKPSEFPEAKEKSCNFDHKILQLKGSIYLDGYWQSYKYFDSISEVIRKEFSFKRPLSAPGLLMAEKIKNSESVFINVRRGDYATNKKSNEFHGVLPLEYFKKATNTMKEKLNNPEFFIFSDDIEWCKNNLFIKHKHTFVDHQYKGVKFSEYLHLMSLCKHSIISNSTFAWWGAWLSDNPNKIVITPQKWFKDSKIDNSDLIPTTWIRQ